MNEALRNAVVNQRRASLIFLPSIIVLVGCNATSGKRRSLRLSHAMI